MMERDAIEVDGFFSITKSKMTGYANINNILYTVLNSDLYKKTGSDIVTVPEGVGEKDFLTCEASLPYSSTPSDITAGLWDTSTDEAKKAILIMTFDYPVTAWRHINTVIEEVSTWKAKAINMDGIYSSVLDPIFLQPIICEASIYLNPFVANQIMNTRLVVSKQLTGRYWVETMAYNLTTGLAKMKLIKL
jgi:hypothetical protein